MCRVRPCVRTMRQLAGKPLQGKTCTSTKQGHGKRCERRSSPVFHCVQAVRIGGRFGPRPWSITFGLGGLSGPMLSGLTACSRCVPTVIASRPDSKGGGSAGNTGSGIGRWRTTGAKWGRASPIGSIRGRASTQPGKPASFLSNHGQICLILWQFWPVLPHF